MIKIDCLEKDIEDILESDSQLFLGLKFVARQVSTPSGVIDVIAYDKINKVYYVVEIKNNCLDSNSFVQVHKYASYMNDRKSKGGGRVFLPLLIGRDLAVNMEKSVIHYDRNNQDRTSLSKTFYTLFSFDPIGGINFSYFNKNQYEYQTEHLETYSEHIATTTLGEFQ